MPQLLLWIKSIVVKVFGFLPDILGFVKNKSEEDKAEEMRYFNAIDKRATKEAYEDLTKCFAMAKTCKTAKNDSCPVVEYYTEISKQQKYEDK